MLLMFKDYVNNKSRNVQTFLFSGKLDIASLLCRAASSTRFGADSIALLVSIRSELSLRGEKFAHRVKSKNFSLIAPRPYSDLA